MQQSDRSSFGGCNGDGRCLQTQSMIWVIEDLFRSTKWFLISHVYWWGWPWICFREIITQFNGIQFTITATKNACEKTKFILPPSQVASGCSQERKNPVRILLCFYVFVFDVFRFFRIPTKFKIQRTLKSKILGIRRTARGVLGPGPSHSPLPRERRAYAFNKTRLRRRPKTAPGREKVISKSCA